ncbi:Coenzyme F420 hydrogenase/dehydrogenase, beta subunit C-terminal domain [Methanobrevibacter filiformis]|uniref:Coenzyme F420-reducing hydrogenase subunit beta n=1 Tax=Methanobrevibacter filiformis TaxID=55758 RepID=A0A166DQC3_9EURY|nr:Coenzyme F420 hydrogenase/dehydrogenase, beta subunit C-terminal domain [Methanobrevibacter filiformis]KZX15841.1 coenzyme F420-reducing hydrogenase subunit beta [Methanobrevibacter filiformis]
MYNKKTAMVGTPCQILAATKINTYDDITGGSPIDLKIGLFCMENFSYTYLKMFLEEKNIDLKDIKEFRIENNMFKVFLNNGEEVNYRLAEIHSFQRKNCDICTDYTADVADISVGSVGSPKGSSTLIIRTEKGKKIVEDAIKEGYITTKSITEKGEELLERIANKKIKGNLENITLREESAHPVLYKREVNEEEFVNLSEECQFDNLKADVIKEGACVLCGACEFVCPINIVHIEERKPFKKGECEENCHACYFACPRTFVSDEILPNSLDKKPLGEYLSIYVANSNVEGQDGGVVTSLLLYLLDKKIVDDVFVVGEDENNPWKPIPKLTNSVEEVREAGGTKYSTVPIGFKALKSE